MNASSTSIKAEVKMLQDRLSKAMNEVKAFAQRFAEQQQQQNGQAQIDPETQAKIIAMQTTAEAKAANTRESHAERTAQRRIQFEMQQEQDALKLQTKAAENALDLQAQASKNALEVAKAAKLAEIEVKKAETTSQQAPKEE